MWWWIVGGLAAAAAMSANARHRPDKLHEPAPRPTPPAPLPAPTLWFPALVGFLVFALPSALALYAVSLGASWPIPAAVCVAFAFIGFGVGAWLHLSGVHQVAEQERLQQATYQWNLNKWQKREDARREEQEKREQSEAAAQAAAEQVLIDEERLRQARAEERRREERERRETAAARTVAVEQRAAAETHRQRGERVRAALLWWTTDWPQAEQYVRASWKQILADAPRERARYDDLDDLAATKECCKELAEWALTTLPDELSHVLPENERNAATLANILRDHHGHFVEWLLPRAQKIERDSRTAATAPTPPPVSEIDKALARLPKAFAEGIGPRLQRVMAVEQLRPIAREILDATRKQLKQQGRPQPEIDDQLDRMEKNFEKEIGEWTIKTFRLI